MVDFHDRRDTEGSGDFNNPKGTYSLTTAGYADQDRWREMSVAEAMPEVHAYYANQKGTETWKEANRLAQGRSKRQSRTYGFENGADYAEQHEGNLVRVMSTKGRDIAKAKGELHHPQSGYGRI